MDNQNCQACSGLQVLTPVVPHNRPGLEQIRYRAGTHAAFLESMLAKLSQASVDVHPGAEPLMEAKQDGRLIRPLLDQLTARKADDPSIAWLDAWASIADILCFYQERIANEGYLPTARTRKSIHELSKLVGYSLKPGLSASTYLAFDVQENSGEIIIPKGTGVQTVPKQGELPQTFETMEDVKGRPEWNEVRPIVRRYQKITPGTLIEIDRIVVEQVGLGVGPNDILLFEFRTEPDHVEKPEEDDTEIQTIGLLRRVDKTVENTIGKSTTVYLRPDELNYFEYITSIGKVIKNNLPDFKLHEYPIKPNYFVNFYQNVLDKLRSVGRSLSILDDSTSKLSKNWADLVADETVCDSHYLFAPFDPAIRGYLPEFFCLLKKDKISTNEIDVTDFTNKIKPILENHGDKLSPLKAFYKKNKDTFPSLPIDKIANKPCFDEVIGEVIRATNYLDETNIDVANQLLNTIPPNIEELTPENNRFIGVQGIATAIAKSYLQWIHEGYQVFEVLLENLKKVDEEFTNNELARLLLVPKVGSIANWSIQRLFENADLSAVVEPVTITFRRNLQLLDQEELDKLKNFIDMGLATPDTIGQIAPNILETCDALLPDVRKELFVFGQFAGSIQSKLGFLGVEQPNLKTIHDIVEKIELPQPIEILIDRLLDTCNQTLTAVQPSKSTENLYTKQTYSFFEQISKTTRTNFSTLTRLNKHKLGENARKEISLTNENLLKLMEVLKDVEGKNHDLVKSISNLRRQFGKLAKEKIGTISKKDEPETTYLVQVPGFLKERIKEKELELRSNPSATQKGIIQALKSFKRFLEDGTSYSNEDIEQIEFGDPIRGRTDYALRSLLGPEHSEEVTRISNELADRSNKELLVQTPPPSPFYYSIYSFKNRTRPFGHDAQSWGPYLEDPSKSLKYKEFELVDEEKKSVFLDSEVIDAKYGERVIIESIVANEKNVDETGTTKLTIREIENVEFVSRDAYGRSSKSTRLTFTKDWWNGEKLSDLRKPVFHIGERRLVPALQDIELPIGPVPIRGFGSEALEPNASFVYLDSLIASLDVGQTVIVSGEIAEFTTTDNSVEAGPRENPTLKTGNITSEICKIENVYHTQVQWPGASAQTIVEFQKPLTNSYVRSSVKISANVAPAGHGERLSEIIGSGNSGISGQKFIPSKANLTFVPAVNDNGQSAEIDVRVNDVQWSEGDNLNQLDATDEKFLVSIKADQSTTVGFGDGQCGARLPTGFSNVKASYRVGLGESGNVDPGSISQLKSPPLGVEKATNPVPATGGINPENVFQGRRNAPIKLASISRIVSAKDFEFFARNQAAVAKAHSKIVNAGAKDKVILTVALGNDVVLDKQSLVYESLKASIEKASGSAFPCEIVTRRLKLLRLAVDVKARPGWQFEKVENEIRERLMNRFSFERAEFGQDIFLADVVSTIQRSSGVEYCNVTTFHGITQTSDQQDIAKQLEDKSKLQFVNVDIESGPDGGAEIAYFSRRSPQLITIEKVNDG